MAASNEQAERAKYGKVVAKAWSDSAFKAKLLKDPHAVLIEAGIEVPAGVSVKVVEETETARYFILPPPHPRVSSATKPSRRWLGDCRIQK